MFIFQVNRRQCEGESSLTPSDDESRVIGDTPYVSSSRRKQQQRKKNKKQQEVSEKEEQEHAQRITMSFTSPENELTDNDNQHNTTEKKSDRSRSGRHRRNANSMRI